MHQCINGLVVIYGISNTIVLEIPYFTTKLVVWKLQHSVLELFSVSHNYCITYHMISVCKQTLQKLYQSHGVFIIHNLQIYSNDKKI